VTTIKKGSAQAFLLNNAVRRVLKHLPGHVDIRVAWIDSKSNPADAISRGLPMDPELVSALGPLGRRLAAAAFRVTCAASGRLSI